MIPTQVEILLIGDVSSKHSAKSDEQDLPKPFRDLITNSLSKIDYILCTGNIGNRKNQKFLKENCKQYIQTKGDKDHFLMKNGNYKTSEVVIICGKKINLIQKFYDDKSNPLQLAKRKTCCQHKRDQKVLTDGDDDDDDDDNDDNLTVIDKEIISVNDYNIGLFHGHNITMRDNIFGRISPCLDKCELLQIEKKMDVDILVFGSTNRMSVEFDKDYKTIFINTGSIIGNDTIWTISPLLILNWVRTYDIIPSNHQFPISIQNLIINFCKRRWENIPTFASLLIEYGRLGQKCTVFTYKIRDSYISKQKIGHFEDLYNYHRNR